MCLEPGRVEWRQGGGNVSAVTPEVVWQSPRPRGARQVARRRPVATVREQFWSLFLRGLEPGSEFREGEAYPAKAAVPGVS